MKKPENSQKAIEQKANAQLNQQTEALSDHVLAQLTLARQQAVAKAQADSLKSNRWYDSKSLMALAASAVIAIPMMWLSKGLLTDDAEVTSAFVQTPFVQDEMTDGEFMLQLADMSEEDMAIVNDLEFIAWLNEQQAEHLDG